jgi:hypothetical protein
MNRKRRKICLKICCFFVCVIGVSMMTACGCTSGRIKVQTTATATEGTKIEKTTVEETTIEETTVEETTVEKTYGIIQIESLEGISLEGNPKIPCTVGLFSQATEAIENPLKITLNEEAEKRKISFSFVGKNNEKIHGITKGVLIEKNEDLTYTKEDVSYIGNVATFAINMPDVSSVEKSTVVVYEISFQKEEIEYTGYLAFCFQ